MQHTPLWPASWLPAVEKSRGSKSVEVQTVWEVYHERLQHMCRDFMVGCTLAAAAVTSCMVEPERWIVPHLAVRTHFECMGGLAGSAYTTLACFLVACFE